MRELTDLGLRFDLTVPLTQFYGNNHSQLSIPFRSFQFGPVWRAERPLKGRYRQFYQCDIDIIGEVSVLAEVELIAHPDFPSSLAGGGRCDKLIGRSLSKDVPACGFSIGFERIIDLLDQTLRPRAVAVLYDTDVPVSRALATARRLRADGQRVATIGRSGKFGAPLARLESWGFRRASAPASRR